MSLAPIRRIATPLTIIVVFLLLSASSLASGGRWLELNSEPDEGAHYVTSVMIRNYVADGLDTPPRQFAERYYLHYPKVAFGIWPPLFHFFLGGWLLATGVSVSSALLFMVLTTTMVAFLIFSSTRQYVGVPVALASAVWFATLPAVQAASSAVMMDMLCVLFMLAAALAFGRYLDGGRTKHALGFAVLAAAAMLTKYNGLALALLPPLAVLATRRWSFLKRRNFWAIPVVVAAITAPWYLTHWQLVQYAADPIPSAAKTLLGTLALAGALNVAILVKQIGYAALPLTLIGIYAFALRRREDQGLWCSLLALLVAVWAFHSFLYPIIDPRYLLASLAAMACFTGAGLHHLVRHMLSSGHADGATALRLTAAAIALLALTTWDPPARYSRGFAEAADLVMASGSRPDVTTLISSDGIGEGAFVAHVATREVQPNSIILRGSKLLATGTWMEFDYAPRYKDPEGVLAVLNRARVQHVVLDEEFERAHNRLLERAIRESPDWRLVHHVPSSRPGSDGSEVDVYSRVTALPPGTPEFELNTVHSLGFNLRAR